MTKNELKQLIRECLQEELRARKPLKESLWTCFFDDREVGTVEAATEYDAKVKMMDEYPEYHYGLYDGCFWVEPVSDNSLTESASVVAAIIDCSGSANRSDIQTLSDVARDLGATEFYYFTDDVYTSVDQALQDYRTNYTKVCEFVENNADKQFIVFTDEDINSQRNGDTLQRYHNVTIERVEKYVAVSPFSNSSWLGFTKRPGVSEALKEAAPVTRTRESIMRTYENNVADHVVELEHEKAFADAEWYEDEWYTLEDVAMDGNSYTLIMDRPVETLEDAELIINYAFNNMLVKFSEAMMDGGIVQDASSNELYVEWWVVDPE